MDYRDQLLDPRWQRRRLEILQRDEFTCQKCLSKDKTLHVHHIEYIKGKMAWEYENYYLKTLCLDCHQLEELLKKQKKNLLKNLKLEGYKIDFPCPACGNDDIMSLNVDHIRCTLCGYTCGILSPSEIERIKQCDKKYQEYLLCQE
jgi:ribosomal protein S27E